MNYYTEQLEKEYMFRIRKSCSEYPKNDQIYKNHRFSNSNQYYIGRVWSIFLNDVNRADIAKYFETVHSRVVWLYNDQKHYILEQIPNGGHTVLPQGIYLIYLIGSYRQPVYYLEARKLIIEKGD